MSSKKFKKKRNESKRRYRTKYDDNSRYFIDGQLLSGKTINKWLDEISAEATYRACMLFLGKLASEKHWSQEEILEFFDSFCRSHDFALEGLLPCEDVQAIVDRYTGISFKEKWY